VWDKRQLRIQYRDRNENIEYQFYDTKYINSD